MKVIVVGNGGREHAIAWKLAQSNTVSEVICVPGNGGTALEEKCRNVAPKDSTYAEIALQEGCSLAVIGPENPLAEGLADTFWQAGIPAVGPKKRAAELEASKNFAKTFMAKYGVASAKSCTFTDMQAALDYVKTHGAPIVIKADGLAAGKGVVVAKTTEEALCAVNDMMQNKSVGEAGAKLVIEDYLCGTEISILAAVSVSKELAENGKACIKPFLSARDHKRLCDGAKGPNTGGMGAICPVADVTPEIQNRFEKDILEPTLKGLVAEGFDYRGFIFFGIMLTKDGPKCLEYNVRLGDPETQAVLPLMDSDFAKLCLAITDGSLKDYALTWKKGFIVSPVAVSGGYPKDYKKGLPIFAPGGSLESKKAKVFIAGAIQGRRSLDSKHVNETGLVTSGGRVLACSAYSPTFNEAWNNAYETLKAIQFEGMFFRKDIGLPGAAEST